MKNSVLAFLSACALLLSMGVLSGETLAKEDEPIGHASTLSKEDIQKGIENGYFCTDAKGSQYTRGAIIKLNDKLYRCVKVYGENFIDNKKLVWVELVIKNGEAVTAD